MADLEIGQADGQEQQTTEPSIEDQAREMGWRPKEEFEGDGRQWVDAKEFVGRKPLFDKIHDQGRKLNELEKTLKATAQHVTKVGEIAYKRAVSELKNERKEAIESADVQRVQEIDNELKDLKDTVTKTEEDDGPPAEYKEWVGKNQWFETDSELYGFACSTFEALQKRNPNEPLGKTLKAVEAATKRAYPEKFGTTHVQQHNSVEGGTRPSNTKTGPGYADLNKDQKRVCDTFVRQGVMTRDAYVKSLVEIGEI